MKSCPYCGEQYSDDTIVCLIDGNKLDGPTEPRNKVSRAPLAKVVCPTCGATDDYTRTVELRGSFSWSIFFLGGIFAVMSRNAARTRKVRCNKCEVLFYIRPPLSRVSSIIFWLLICPTIIAFIILVIALLHILFSK